MAARWRVLLFAGLRDLAGTAVLEVELPEAPSRVAAIQEAAEALCPALRGARYRVAVDAAYAAAADPVPPGAEVAFIPPVSGG